ncbi:glycosyltransferase family 2 protein [Enterovibrio sp. ZSDZ35]|uniref:Glycosyltransferase family 2 protein n=1 Tax=Enterovibrio qingdaonensis TaxID=2899818 RepID=A0ABT5QSI8_9GAMM|nr:glycosyltransferase family 2 protein [Enterovibrio sp. ZSDZ35]MDD1783957.1 glycosyltransferase family 2 protein [Enterovibrio sp. ZSDZ35]
MTSTWIYWITAISIFLVIYHHLGYPLLLKVLVRCTPSDKEGNADQKMLKDNDLPTITVLMPAYNEARWIADKIRNLASLDYPADKLDIIVACDGCSDDTAAIARQTALETPCSHLNLYVAEYEENRGKVAVLNKSMCLARGDLVALTDISALISIDAFRIAAQRFTDEKLGVMNSQYCLMNANSSESNYWKYQCKIQQFEAKLGSSLGSHGALYIIRRELYCPLPADTINDDFVLPMNIVAQGYRADVDTNIRAVELEASSNQQDFRRRLRIGAGNCQQLFRLMTLLMPSRGGVAFTFASGKALRVVMPFLMIAALVGSIAIAPTHWFFACAALVQSVIYLSILACQLAGYEPKNAIVRAIRYLVAGHTANLIGTLRYISGLERGRWTRVSTASSISRED